MKKDDYLKHALDSFNRGEISVEAYDAIVQNVDVFCEGEEYDDAELERMAEETEQEGAYLSFVQDCYEKYKADWCAERGCFPKDVDEEVGINGECYVCLEEFEWAEFQDEEYMKTLLSSVEFSQWESFVKDPMVLPVDVISCGKKRHFDTRSDALEFYAECMLNTQGSELERFSDIYLRLVSGSEPVISDGVMERREASLADKIVEAKDEMAVVDKTNGFSKEEKRTVGER